MIWLGCVITPVKIDLLISFIFTKPRYCNFQLSNFPPQYIPWFFHFSFDITILPTILNQILDEVFKYRNLNISQLASFSPQLYVFPFSPNITIIHQIALGDTKQTFQIYRSFPVFAEVFRLYTDHFANLRPSAEKLGRCLGITRYTFTRSVFKDTFLAWHSLFCTEMLIDDFTVLDLVP